MNTGYDYEINERGLKKARMYTTATVKKEIPFDIFFWNVQIPRFPVKLKVIDQIEIPRDE